MFVELPSDLAVTISERAVRYAREYTQKKNWSTDSTQSLVPISGPGQAGIYAGKKYLLYQSRGTRPYVMWSLEGKTIPMGGGQFRRAVGVGTPGYVTLPGNVKVWRDQKWRHPGLQPQRFLEDSVNRAIEELRRPMREILKKRLEGNGRTNFGDDLRNNYGGLG